uniref:urotensin 2 domain containing n=1 Tax=Doryrhamphus excisus TaxID=161450 RepID=UPI0025ADC26A|nr:urotensin 2 domain containing [Doryrhamphus excisus]
MDRVRVVNYLFGVLALALLQGVIHVEGRSLFNTGNTIFHPKDNADVQGKILSLLLHRSSIPVEKIDPPGLELVDKLAELEELEALREDLELEKELTANLADKPATRKRGEPCFWKYCV